MNPSTPLTSHLPAARLAPAMSANAAAPWPYPVWIAHRGAGLLAPENTLAAMRLGASLGWRAFECDVKLSAEGVPYLMHDDTLDRTTDGTGPAAGQPWLDLSRLDAGGWHGRSFAGEPLPSLDAVAAWSLANGLALNLELKPVPDDEERTGQVVALAVQELWVEAVQQARAPWPLLSSFNLRALAAAQQAAPELPRALLLESLWPDCFDLAARLDCCAIVLEESLVHADLIRQIHHDGLKVLAYTVNDPVRAALLLELGLDGIITDAVNQFVPAN